MAESEEDRHLKLAGEFDCLPEPLPTLRHSTSHVMAQAVRQLFPDVKVAIGPAIDDGFYYDFEKATPFTPEDLERIEAGMRTIVAADLPFTREEWPREEAIAYFKERDEPFKVEILDGLAVPTVSVYRQGDFLDLCRGPHVASTGAIRAFKLLSSSGAYWRGDEKNPMLQRIYGTAWLTQEDLDKHLWRIEEARKRDHRKLGRELELFEFHDIAPGAPFWLPNGMIVFRQLEQFWREVHDDHGYLETSTPILVNKKLWEQSGHWALYADNMFKLDVEEQMFGLKPMNCPESTFIYRHALRSYRDLPLRIAEIGRLHRNERSGTLTGLFRVRQITMDDAHIYCRPDQVQEEITGVLGLVREFYRLFELEPSYKIGTRPAEYLGTLAQWDAAERGLHEALRANQLAYDEKPGDGAFYGPKIDIHIEDALGRNWQIATIQLDLTMLPEQFDLTYIDSDGTAKRPMAIHRAIFGSCERFIDGKSIEDYLEEYGLGDVVGALAQAAEGAADLELLLLFGSRAREDSHDRSDWDLAYLASESFDPSDLLTRAVEILGTDRVDLVDLRRASGLLRYRAARDGQLLFEAKPGLDDAFRLEATRFWCEVEPLLQRGYDDVLAGLAR
jgi:threonyl-tRNA synthetase